MTDYARPTADGGITIDTHAAPHSYDELLDALIGWKIAEQAHESLRLAPEPLRERSADTLAQAEDEVRGLLTAPLSREQARTLSNQLRCLLNVDDLHPSGDRKRFPASLEKAWATQAAKAAQDRDRAASEWRWAK